MLGDEIVASLTKKEEDVRNLNEKQKNSAENSNKLNDGGSEIKKMF